MIYFIIELVQALFVYLSFHLGQKNTDLYLMGDSCNNVWQMKFLVIAILVTSVEVNDITLLYSDIHHETGQITDFSKTEGT